MLLWLSESGASVVVILLFALIVERWVPWPARYHPLTLFRLVAANMAKKVNPKDPNNQRQALISGTLSVIVLLLPMALIIGISLVISAYPELFDLLLLVIALQFRPILQSFQGVKANLQKQKPSLARFYLTQIVLRDTDTLSQMGIGKAAIESVLLRFGYQQVNIIIWYFSFGALSALLVRLIYELSQCWNLKLPSFRYFGRPIYSLRKITFILPSILYGATFSLLWGVVSAIRSIKRSSVAFKQTFTLKASLAGALGFQLGGPAYYAGKKVRFPKVGETREVRFDDLSRAKNAIDMVLLFLCILVLLFLVYIVTN